MELERRPLTVRTVSSSAEAVMRWFAVSELCPSGEGSADDAEPWGMLEGKDILTLNGEMRRGTVDGFLCSEVGIAYLVEM